MGWRTVVISNRAKLECSLGSLVVRNKDGFKKIPIDEISMIIVESTAVSITAALLAELDRKKVKIIFCDEKRSPFSEMVSYNGAYDSSMRIRRQIQWDDSMKSVIWTHIVAEKIKNQRDILKKWGHEEWKLLDEYITELELNDDSNREGHAAKVYFNALFGKEFSRNKDSFINAALNYGYSIIRSTFNREIVAYGYLTQLGIFHHNVHNHFNLSCDLMEPFRPLIDDCVIKMKPEKFEQDEKLVLIDILNQTVIINGKKNTVQNAIGINARSIIDALDENDLSKIRFLRNEL